jgi:hypothetical protein
MQFHCVRLPIILLQEPVPTNANSSLWTDSTHVSEMSFSMEPDRFDAGTGIEMCFLFNFLVISFNLYI